MHHTHTHRMNILLDRHSTGKLADFGFSIQLPKTHGNKTMITASVGLPGTNGYRPPEYGYSKFSVLSDVYSLGVVSIDHYLFLLFVFHNCHFTGGVGVFHRKTCLFRRSQSGMVQQHVSPCYCIMFFRLTKPRMKGATVRRLLDWPIPKQAQWCPAVYGHLINEMTKRIPSKRPKTSIVSVCLCIDYVTDFVF